MAPKNDSEGGNANYVPVSRIERLHKMSKIEAPITEPSTGFVIFYGTRCFSTTIVHPDLHVEVDMRKSIWLCFFLPLVFHVVRQRACNVKPICIRDKRERGVCTR